MKKKIKLLHITSSLKIGGAEVVLCDLVNKLGNEEFDHHVIYFHAGPNVAKVINSGAKTYQIKGAFFMYDPIFFVSLFCLIKKLKPDVVHSLLWSANISSRIICKMLKLPNVSVYHNNICQDGRFRNILDKFTRSMSEKIISVSDEVGNSLNYDKLNSKYLVIKNGIDVEQIKNNNSEYFSKSDIGFSNQNFIIGAVGRLEKVKNFRLLLESFALVIKKNGHVRLVIVGSGSQERFLKDLANDLKIRDYVNFAGTQKSLQFYPIFDCFVQPSTKEGLSIALLEAMSFALCCIVMGEQKRHPVIENKINGIVVSPEDKSALCSAILRLVDDFSYAKSLGRQAKDFVSDRFRLAVMVGQYRETFKALSNMSNSKLSARRDI